MANTIKPKRSYTLSTVPSGLAAGELAINASATPKVWIGNSTGTGNVLIASLSLSDMAGSTTNITEGTNLYYTDARARTALSSSATGLTYTSGTGAFSLTAGYSIPTTSSQTNWDSAYTQRLQWDGGSTNLVAATARTSLGLTIGTNVQAWDADLDAIAALAGTSGLLKKTAANTWSLDTTAYGSGTVTSVVAGSYLTGGTITTTGTIAVDATSANTASKVVARDASGNFSAGTITATLTGTASKATNIIGGNSTTLLGAIPYQSNTDTTSLLSPNTTTTKNFLSQTGTGTNGATPSWSAVSKSDVGLSSVENTAISTWAGSTNVTTLGTVATGTWNATAIGLSKGGTNANLTAANGGIVYSDASALAILAAGTSGQLLQSNGAAAPSWVASPGVPTGSLFPYAGSSAPTGYLLCNGAAVSRSTYATLFGILSTTYGSGDGSTTFNLPDLRGRFPMGAGTGTGLNSSGTGLPSGTAQTARTAGQWGGEETHQLTTANMPSHSHNGATNNAGSHTHTLSREVLTYVGSGGSRYDPYPGSVWTGSPAAGLTISTASDHSHGIPSNGSDGRHATIPPFVVLNYIIKT